MSESTSRTVRSLPLAISVVLGVAGGRLLLEGTLTSVSAGVLLVVAALAGAGIALGGAAFGPAEEGNTDLSARIGLGLLGGLLAGIFHGVLTVLAGWLDLGAILGINMTSSLEAADWMNRVLLGSAWGLALGVAWHFVPGNSAGTRGAAFGLLLAVWQLFFVYPFRMGLGIAGIEIGLGLTPLVLIGFVSAGFVAGRAIGWGDRTELAPVSSALVD
jgi:hypothetical protein